MNLREFNALKVGDKIENVMTHGEGTVSTVVDQPRTRIVSVKWSLGGNGIEYSYSTHSTAWMHWSNSDAK